MILNCVVHCKLHIIVFVYIQHYTQSDSTHKMATVGKELTASISNNMLPNKLIYFKIIPVELFQKKIKSNKGKQNRTWKK